MKKVAVLFHDGFEEVEALSVVDIMRRANVECTMVGMDKLEVTSSHQIKIKMDQIYDGLDNYDAVVIPGGMPGASNLRDDSRVIDLVKQFNHDGKIIGAICAGPIVLQEADVIKGKTVTCYPGFEEQLIGKMPGETVQVKVTFPKDYQGKEVAGKDAVFETTINYIDETPKLTDKFVKEKLSDRYGYTTVKEMKKTIRDEIFKTNKTDYIWNHMIEKSKFEEIPDELINDRVDVLVNGLKAQLKASNYTWKDYLSAYGIEDETSLRDQYKSSCESTVKVFLIADAIAADKKISVTDEDVKAYFNGEDTAQYEKQYSKAYINRIVLNNLVIQEIEKNVTVK